MEPIIKWAGGKRQLLSELKKRLPKEYGTYFEPFFGAGALFFDIQPKKAYINDFNHSLINLYDCCKNYNNELKSEMEKLETGFNNSLDKTKYFYEKRNRFNEILNKDSFEEAALFVFLNRTDYNGLFRVNSKGEFNVPFGKRKSVNLMFDRIDEANKALKKTKISEGDFASICKKAKSGDFVYFDPPYDDTFVDYQANGFSKTDQIRLYKLFKSLTEKGVYCMLSNSYTDFILDLYKEFNIDVIDVKRLINRNANNRTGKEVIITNYEVKYD